MSQPRTKPIYHPDKPYTREEQAHNRKLWIAALRSGKYLKGEGYLHDTDNRFCCLGVAAEFLGVPSKLQSGDYYYGEGLENTLAPTEIMHALGLRSYLGSPSEEHTRTGSRLRNLITYNDEGLTNKGEPMTFDDIAMIIESNIDDYFFTEATPPEEDNVGA